MDLPKKVACDCLHGMRKDHEECIGDTSQVTTMLNLVIMVLFGAWVK